MPALDLGTTAPPAATFEAGKSADIIAGKAQIRVAPRTRVLLAPLERIGDDYPLSREKLCPVLGFFAAAGRDAAINACKAMTRRSGAG